ncbi:MAG: 5'/3'-nucleotidase SurE [Armatimonadetes bacterium]|nr:5'/3'-nucleotidase SurE [Armatimonadota bacterium]
MKILLTNDDGIHAPGLLALAEAAEHLGEIAAVAPDRERSACGHAMTMRDPLRVAEKGWTGPGRGWQVNGLPVDCVNVARKVAWPEGIDLVLSGINNGPNLGFDVTYSGTVAGAMEGCINHIRSIAVSMAIFVDGSPYHYETGTRWLQENLDWLVRLELPELVFLNINIPAIEFSEVQGHRFTRMGKRVYEDRVEYRSDPWGRPYYWQGGVVVMKTDEEGSDVRAVTEGFVSITPISLDWTHSAVLDSLQSRSTAHSR